MRVRPQRIIIEIQRTVIGREAIKGIRQDEAELNA